MPVFFHVSLVRNRESIRMNGLDSARMASARGIAGSHRPEVDGILLCAEEFTVACGPTATRGNPRIKGTQ